MPGDSRQDVLIGDDFKGLGRGNDAAKPKLGARDGFETYRR